MVERRERDQPKNMYKWPMDMNNSVGTDCGSGEGGAVRWRREKGKIGTTVIE